MNDPLGGLNRWAEVDFFWDKVYESRRKYKEAIEAGNLEDATIYQKHMEVAWIRYDRAYAERESWSDRRRWGEQ